MRYCHLEQDEVSNHGALRSFRVPLTPSKVDVPRPSSSRMTRLRDVLLSRIKLVSTISTMNVDRPLANSSEAIQL